MGYGVAASQCLVAPPYVLAGVLMWATSWAGDKYRLRGPILVLNSVITLIGLPIMGFASSAGVRYFGVFITTAGTNANIPASMAYQANNIRGQWTRAFASASLVGLGGVGGIAGSLVFRSQDAPRYLPGIWASIAYVVLSNSSFFCCFFSGTNNANDDIQMPTAFNYHCWSAEHSLLDQQSESRPGRENHRRLCYLPVYALNHFSRRK